jgi:hypothetical protein
MTGGLRCRFSYAHFLVDWAVLRTPPQRHDMTRKRRSIIVEEGPGELAAFQFAPKDKEKVLKRKHIPHELLIPN